DAMSPFWGNKDVLDNSRLSEIEFYSYQKILNQLSYLNGETIDNTQIGRRADGSLACYDYGFCIDERLFNVSDRLSTFYHKNGHDKALSIIIDSLKGSRSDIRKKMLLIEKHPSLARDY
ncbi:MAG: hypothetical protein K9M13_02075, partial [Simkaniaceae bacterium]|nr:hypothetical protein [Simkaniaceae bacterium]